MKQPTNNDFATTYGPFALSALAIIFIAVSFFLRYIPWDIAIAAIGIIVGGHTIAGATRWQALPADLPPAIQELLPIAQQLLPIVSQIVSQPPAQVAAPAQQVQKPAPQPILFPNVKTAEQGGLVPRPQDTTVNPPQGGSVIAPFNSAVQNPTTLQASFQPAVTQQFRATPPLVPMPTNPPALSTPLDTTRHFGDSVVMPVVQPDESFLR